MHLVIGGSKGIGQELVKSLILRGESVVSLSRSAQQVTYANFLSVYCDLMQSETIELAVSSLKKMKCKFQTVTFCAALQNRSTSQWDLRQYRNHMMVNCFGQAMLYSGLISGGCLAPRPTLLYFGSQAGDDGSAWAPAYAMSKAAMWTWLKSVYWSAESSRRPILNRILPGRVNTPGNPKRQLSAHDIVPFREPHEIMSDVLRMLDLRPPTDHVLKTVDLGVMRSPVSKTLWVKDVEDE